METRKFDAAEKKRCGSHNCAQAVLCSYCDLTGIDEETSRNMTTAFAAGMGNMEGTCGAIVGAGIALSLITKDKAKAVKGMREIMTRFEERNKVLRECPDCVADAAEFLEDIINTK